MEKYQVAVIGGGPAGYTAAEAAGRAGLTVVLFEKGDVGGVCLNEGCIPTKTLLYAAKTLDTARHAANYGVKVEGNVVAGLPKMVARKQKVVRKLVLGIKARLAAAGVTLVTGTALIEDRNHVRCGETVYECGNLLVCTGSEPFVPSLPGTDVVPYWTHREALDCKEAPGSLLVMGGGVIGMEFASYFNSLGTAVTVVEMQDEILGGMDGELCALLRAAYAKRGVAFKLGARVTALRSVAGGEGTPQARLAYEDATGEGVLAADRLLVSVGRRPVTRGFGLENLGLLTDGKGRVRVDEHMRTSVAGVYVCGDLTGRSLLAHTAAREAEVAVNDLLGRADAMSYRAIPAVVYTNPELAGVGETEASLRQKGVPYRVAKLPMAYSGRFVAENEGVNGLCKLLVGEDGTVLGAHVLGNPASEIITLAAMAIGLRLKTEEWKRIVFPHPTVGEIFREAVSFL